MPTTLANCMIVLAKELNDYWDGTTTSDGAADGTTVIDTALKAQANDWVTDYAYDRITSGTYDGEERKVSSLGNTTGTLTVLAHTGKIVSGVTYEVHRLLSASDKRKALIYAAKAGFPYIFKQVRDESKTVGNWLKNGDVENWASSSYPDNWRVSAVTAAKNTTAPYYTRGSTSCKLSTAAGYLYQSNTENTDLMDLKGKSITFSAQVWSNTASDTRLAIYDGTTTTYSSYHAGDSAFAELSVTATIAASPSQVSFRVYITNNTTTAYVDDLRAIGPTRDKIDISDLGLALNYPHQVFQADDTAINEEPWGRLRNYEIGSDGYVYLSEGSQDYRLRIIGIGYLDFLVSGVSSTAWAATIAIDSPQTEILVAEAAMYLCRQMILPNFSSGESKRWEKALDYWDAELALRRGKYGMKTPGATVQWFESGRSAYKSRYGRVNY